MGSPVRVRPPLLVHVSGRRAPETSKVRSQASQQYEAAQVRQDRRSDKGVTVAKNEKRIQVTLACEECKRRNYITTKNKVNDRERIEMKKFCNWERRHTVHKETR